MMMMMTMMMMMMMMMMMIIIIIIIIIIIKVRSKAVTLQAWTGPECSRRLRLQDFKTIGT